MAFAEMREVELAGLEAPGPVEGDKIDGIDGREGVIGHGRSTFGIGSTDADSETFASIPPWRPLPVVDIWGSEIEGEVILVSFRCRLCVSERVVPIRTIALQLGWISP